MTKKDKDVEAVIRDCGPVRYKFSEVKKMTNSFKHLIGEGGVGEVYFGRLSIENDCPVAVKLIKSNRWGETEFLNEVSSIRRTAHVNVVKLLGFCLEGQRRILIFEFMYYGSLDKFIHNHSVSNNPLNNNNTNTPPLILGWEKLHQIAVGIARGLDYLHTGCNIPVLHLDIKPRNILLDENFCPKITDFGLAKHFPSGQSAHNYTIVRGTVGYIAPEFRCSGIASFKADVYSYGIMILEMVTRRKVVNLNASHDNEMCLSSWVYMHLALGNNNILGFIEDIRTTEDHDIAKKMLFVGLRCILENPSDRPSMSRVIEMLLGNIESLQMPLVIPPETDSYISEDDLQPITDGGNAESLQVTENPFISSRQQVTDPYLSEDDLPPTTQGGNIESSQVSENHFISLQRPLISPPQVISSNTLEASNEEDNLPATTQGFWTAFDESDPREAPIAPQAQSTIPSHPSSGLLAANEEADFRGLGKIRNEYIPLLEEAISQQPHLWSCQESRTKQCRRWAYSALGRVLHFLRNVKIKDLTAEKKAEFDKLWREMDLFNFDLTWLAIKQDEVMNAGVDEEMVMAEEEQKAKILSMELGINEMKWKLMEAEQELEKQRRVLADLERDQPNLDSVLNF